MQVQYRYKLPKGMIFHSDRGSQYTSRAFMDMLKQYQVRQSFSRVGMPGDNSWTESFFATLKKECVHWCHFITREAARQGVWESILQKLNPEPGTPWQIMVDSTSVKAHQHSAGAKKGAIMIKLLVDPGED